MFCFYIFLIFIAKIYPEKNVYDKGERMLRQNIWLLIPGQFDGLESKELSDLR